MPNLSNVAREAKRVAHPCPMFTLCTKGSIVNLLVQNLIQNNGKINSQLINYYKHINQLFVLSVALKMGWLENLGLKSPFIDYTKYFFIIKVCINIPMLILT